MGFRDKLQSLAKNSALATALATGTGEPAKADIITDPNTRMFRDDLDLRIHLSENSPKVEAPHASDTPNIDDQHAAKLIPEGAGDLLLGALGVHALLGGIRSWRRKTEKLLEDWGAEITKTEMLPDHNHNQNPYAPPTVSGTLCRIKCRGRER